MPVTVIRGSGIERREMTVNEETKRTWDLRNVKQRLIQKDFIEPGAGREGRFPSAAREGGMP